MILTEEMITKTNIRNRFCTCDTIPTIEVWSVAGDFFDCQEEVCQLFKERYGDEAVTMVTPFSSVVAPYYANMLSKLASSLMRVNHVWDISIDDDGNAHPDEEMCEVINNRHILIIDETLVSRKDIEDKIQTIATIYDPKSITILCRYRRRKDSGRSYFAEHAVINRNDGPDSVLPADKYRVFIQNDHAIYHPAQIHVISKEEKFHVVLYLQNGRRWLVKNYGHRSKTDDFADIKEKVNLWFSQPSQLAMTGGMTNREQALGLWEINNPSAKLCRIGFIGENSEFEVYVNKDDFGYVPHLHIRRLGIEGENYFETRVKLLTNEYYFPESRTKMRLTREQCAMLAELMEKPSCHLQYKTNYDYATWSWTMNNKTSARKPGRHMPDYRTIYDVVEVRVDTISHKDLNESVIRQVEEALKD